MRMEVQRCFELSRVRLPGTQVDIPDTEEPSDRKSVERSDHNLDSHIPTNPSLMTTVCFYGLCDMKLVDLRKWPDLIEDMSHLWRDYS